MGESSAMGLYDVPRVMYLPCLGIGIIFAFFHVCGMVFVLRERLNIAVRYVSTVTPMCLRSLIFMLSGPVELLFLTCLISREVCPIVICMGVDLSLLVNLPMILYLRCVVCFTRFLNCLLKCSAFCLSVIAVLLSKVMAMLGVCGGFLCARPFKVFLIPKCVRVRFVVPVVCQVLFPKCLFVVFVFHYLCFVVLEVGL